MVHFPLIALIVVAGLALVHAFLMGVHTWEHRRFVRRRLAELDRFHPTGQAMVFVPCKGVDIGLEANLRRFFQQDYDDYEITFVVESPWDPACDVISRVMARYPDRVSHLVVAGRAVDCGQKVHNLHTAVRRILSSRIELLAFADSDARPRREWLRVLLGRLNENGSGKVGAVTGYRWMTPIRPSLANHLLYSINCGVATLLGSRRRYPIWGGSWAIRRDTFEAVGMIDAWRGTLSDDLVATRVLRRHHLDVCFEPACMVASPTDGTLGDHLEFLRRQYVISRCYLPSLWWCGLAWSSLHAAGWVAMGTLLVWAVAAGSSWTPAAAVACLTLYGLGVIRAAMRQKLLDLYVPGGSRRMAGASRFDIWGGFLAGLINAATIVGSSVGCRIRWRNIAYRLKPGGQTEILDHRWPLAEPAASERNEDEQKKVA
ncbi:MAG TPA: glycosyltransferase [Thermoguttaceae bacterium]|nr:glycosyltransferase [Thermoguttaceae bacterium]